MPAAGVEGGEAAVWTRLVVPEATRSGRPMSLAIEYGNEGLVDARAPWLLVQVVGDFGWPAEDGTAIDEPFRFEDVFEIDEHVVNKAARIDGKRAYKGDPTWFYMPFYVCETFEMSNGKKAKGFDWLVNMILPERTGEVMLAGVIADAGGGQTVMLGEGQIVEPVRLSGNLRPYDCHLCTPDQAAMDASASAFAATSLSSRPARPRGHVLGRDGDGDVDRGDIIAGQDDDADLGG